MAKQALPDQVRRSIEKAQRREITEYHIYRRLSETAREAGNKKLFLQIAQEEKKHANFWKERTKKTIAPNRIEVQFYTTLAQVLGVTFAVKLMEKSERSAQDLYLEIKKDIPEAKDIIADEKKHEDKLIQLINEERLSYVSSIVLGLNDALVELTGALAGLTLALQNAQLVAVAGLITGIAASFSMAASEYLSTKAEDDPKKSAAKAALYTGVAYIGTVIVLITPYFIFNNLYISLGISLTCAIGIILFFTFYTSVAQDKPFYKRFFEMAGISLGIALLTFIIGYVIRNILHVDI